MPLVHKVHAQAYKLLKQGEEYNCICDLNADIPT